MDGNGWRATGTDWPCLLGVSLGEDNQGPSLLVTQLQAARAHCTDGKPRLLQSGDRLLWGVRVEGSQMAQVLGCLEAPEQ